MISILFIILAAISFAVVDVLTHHFPRSVFSTLNPQWWNPKKSWKNSYVNWDIGIRRKKILFMVSDASNSFTYLTVMFFILAIVSEGEEYFSQSLVNSDIGRFTLDIVIAFFVYLLTYLLFYRVIFRRK
jgi:hypothetical protein